MKKIGKVIVYLIDNYPRLVASFMIGFTAYRIFGIVPKIQTKLDQLDKHNS